MATYKRPESIFQYMNEDNLLWVTIEAHKLKSQTTGLGGGTINVEPGGPVDVFKFLAPLSISEVHSHNWEEYESMGAKMAGTAISLARAGIAINESIGAMKKGAEAVQKAFNDKSGNLAERVINILGAAAGGASTNYKYYKIDNPLVYKSSSRRTINLEFQLVTELNDPEKYVMKPIKKLQEYAAPQVAENNNIEITPPHVFKIYSAFSGHTQKNGPINMNWSALESLQPTYKSPYIKGMPSSAEIILQFKELLPLYSKSVYGQGKVTVGGGTSNSGA